MSASRTQVDGAIRRLGKLDRKEAVELLEKHGARNTAELKPEDYPAVIREAEERFVNVRGGMP